MHPEGFRVDQIELDMHVEVFGIDVGADHTLMIFKSKGLRNLLFDVFQDICIRLFAFSE